MKKKIILGVLTVMTAICSFNEAKASAEDHDGECKAPTSNTCMVIHTPLGSITKKGVLTINM